jgi:hypothetical protein
MQPRRRHQIRRPDLGFPPVVKAGKHGQHHDDASEKETAPAGVAVVSFTRGFRPGPAVNPIAQRIRAEKTDFGTPTKRGEPYLSKAEQGALISASPPGA